MKQKSKGAMAANVFGTLGYISVLFQWAWTFLIIIYPLLVSRPAFLFPKPEQPTTAPSVSLGPEFTPLMAVIAVIVTLAIVIFTIVILIRLPKNIGKKAAQITHSTANALIPAVTSHRTISKPERKRLSYELVSIIKLLLVSIPLLVLPFTSGPEQVPRLAMWTIALFCAGVSMLYFIIQQIIVRSFRVDTSTVW